MRKLLTVAAVLALAGSASAQTFTINFDTDAAGNPIPEGATFANQYAAWGVTAVPNIFNPANGWATNTDMTITSTDTGGGYLASYGKILHAFGNVYPGWLAEDGDPNFGLFFNQPIDSISVGFTGDSSGLSEVDAFDSQGNFITGAVVSGGNINLKTVTLSGLAGLGVTTISAISPGSFGDWVGVVSITFTYVPAPASLALLGMGGLVATRRRR
jgi:hypothetical protein